MVVFIIFFVFFCLVIAAVVSASLRSDNQVGEAGLEPAQMRCHGVWSAEIQRQQFHFCIHEIGQFIEGIYMQNGEESQFSGSYLAPNLRFEKLNADGSSLTFSGRVGPDGFAINGTCSNYDVEIPWSAKLLSDPSQTKALDLGILRNLALTYIVPGAEVRRAHILASAGGVIVDLKHSTPAHESVRVWKLSEQEISDPTLVPPNVVSKVVRVNPVETTVIPVETLRYNVELPAKMQISKNESTESLASSSSIDFAPSEKPSSSYFDDLQTSVSTASSASTLDKAESYAAKLTCSKCSADMDPAFDFCLHCGYAP